jgi:hypothetical protein
VSAGRHLVKDRALQRTVRSLRWALVSRSNGHLACRQTHANSGLRTNGEVWENRLDVGIPNAGIRALFLVRRLKVLLYDPIYYEE